MFDMTIVVAIVNCLDIFRSNCWKMYKVFPFKLFSYS